MKLNRFALALSLGASAWLAFEWASWNSDQGISDSASPQTIADEIGVSESLISEGASGPMVTEDRTSRDSNRSEAARSKRSPVILYADGITDPLEAFFYVQDGRPQLSSPSDSGATGAELVGVSKSGFIVRTEGANLNSDNQLPVAAFFDVTVNVERIGGVDGSPHELRAQSSAVHPILRVDAPTLGSLILEVHASLVAGDGTAQDRWDALSEVGTFWSLPFSVGFTNQEIPIRIPTALTPLHFYLPSRPSNLDFVEQPAGTAAGPRGTRKVLASVDMYTSTSKSFAVDPGSSLRLDLIHWASTTLTGSFSDIAFDDPALGAKVHVSIQHEEVREGVLRREKESFKTHRGPSFVVSGLRPGKKNVTATHYLAKDHVQVYTTSAGPIPSGALWDLGEVSVDPWTIRMEVEIEDEQGDPISEELWGLIEDQTIKVMPAWMGNEGGAFTRNLNVPLRDGITVDGLKEGSLQILLESLQLELEDGRKVRLTQKARPATELLRPPANQDWRVTLVYVMKVTEPRRPRAG